MNNQVGDCVRTWLAEPMPHDVVQAVARTAAANDVQRVAVMPDVHLAEDVCVGLAVATKSLIYPQAVGNDIGCGMAAIAFDAEADLLADENAAGHVLAGLYQSVPAMRQRRALMPEVLPDDIAKTALSHSRLEKMKQRDGRVQLGTLGRGNHFLEFQRDTEGRLWLMVHSGSRGIGQAIAGHHLAIAQLETSAKRLPWLVADSHTGQAYLADMNWAVRYAGQNRLAMIRVVAAMVQRLFSVSMDESSLIHSDHNHVRREAYENVEFWIHRKGALAAQDGLPGVIPGSMGAASFHVVGRGCEAALCSSSHGAGRALSRGQARNRIGARQVGREMHGIWFDYRKSDQLRDEAPSAYKDIHAVMRAQRDLTRVVRELRPILSYKGV